MVVSCPPGGFVAHAVPPPGRANPSDALRLQHRDSPRSIAAQPRRNRGERGSPTALTAATLKLKVLVSPHF